MRPSCGVIVPLLPLDAASAANPWLPFPMTSPPTVALRGRPAGLPAPMASAGVPVAGVVPDAVARDGLGVIMPEGRGEGVTKPEGGTGMAMSSGEPGTILSGRPGMWMRLAELL